MNKKAPGRVNYKQHEKFDGGVTNLNELEKIDLIRSRVGVSYAEAKQALDAAEGDVVGR